MYMQELEKVMGQRTEISLRCDWKVAALHFKSVPEINSRPFPSITSLWLSAVRVEGEDWARPAARSSAQFAPFVLRHRRCSSGALLLQSEASVSVEAGFREWLYRRGALLLQWCQRGKYILSVPCQMGRDIVGNIFSRVFDKPTLSAFVDWFSLPDDSLSLPDVHLCL